MTLFLYMVLGLSALAPIYTYFIYPYVLRLFKKRSRNTSDNYAPTVSVLVIEPDREIYRKKELNVRESDFTKIIDIIWVANQLEAAKQLTKIKTDVVVVTDGTSSLKKDTISNVIRTLSGKKTGLVCGMVRKSPDENGEFRDGANWRYENKIKVLESNIGCLSGANTAIYALKKDVIPTTIHQRINLDFFLPTAITEKGYDVLFEPNAVAYEEERTEGDLFKKHVEDGSSGYCSILRFWRLLLPRKGCFVFWSHRVMKWLVPFNMLIILLGCAWLAQVHVWALLLFLSQILFYIFTVLYYLLFTLKGKEVPGPIGKLSNFASYFVVLNAAWFLGLFYKKN